MSYIIVRNYKGPNYNWEEDRRDQLLFVCPSKEKAEAKVIELHERLNLTTRLWQDLHHEISLWERTNPPPKGSPMRVKWSEKHFAMMGEKCAATEREHHLPEGWLLKTVDTLNYRIEEVEDL